MRLWLALTIAACRDPDPGPAVVPAEIAAALHCPAGTTVGSRGAIVSGRDKQFPLAWCARDGSRDGLHISWDDADPSSRFETEWRGDTQIGVERNYEHGRLQSAADAGLFAWFRSDGTVSRIDERPAGPGKWTLQLGRVEEPTEASRGGNPACKFEGSQHHPAVSGPNHVDADGKQYGWTITWTIDRTRKWQEGMYEHGKREGPWTFFDTCGQPLFELRYEHDRLVGFDGKSIPR